MRDGIGFGENTLEIPPLRPDPDERRVAALRGSGPAPNRGLVIPAIADRETFGERDSGVRYRLTRQPPTTRTRQAAVERIASLELARASSHRGRP